MGARTRLGTAQRRGQPLPAVGMAATLDTVDLVIARAGATGECRVIDAKQSDAEKGGHSLFPVCCTWMTTSPASQRAEEQEGIGLP